MISCGCVTSPSNPVGPQNKTEALPSNTSKPVGDQESEPSEACEEFDSLVSANDSDLSTRYVFENPQPPFETQAAVTQAATDRRPGILTLEFINRTSTRVSLQFGGAPPLSGLELNHERTDASIVLVPPNLPSSVSVVDHNEDGEFSIVPDEPMDGCWTAADLPVVQDSFQAISLGPCDSFQREYYLLNHPENTACRPSGIYTRTDEGSVREDNETTDRFKTRLSVQIP